MAPTDETLRAGLVLHPQSLAVSDPGLIFKLDRVAWSPSSSSSFRRCPGRWATSRLLPSVPDPFGAAETGSAGHLVLEILFALPAQERTLDRAAQIIETLHDPQAHGRARGEIDAPATPADLLRWRATVIDKISGLWRIEDPRSVHVLGLERSLSGANIDGVPFVGFMDRTSAITNTAGEVIGSRVEDYKGLDRNTPLPTPTGWTTMGAVQVGDQLFGSDGKPCTVTAKSGIHDRPCYRVSFDDGTHLIADNVHLWEVHRDSGVQVLSTQDMIPLLRAGRGGQSDLRIPNTRALDLPDADLPLDPYVLGVWLGDGKASSGEVSRPDLDLFDECARRGFPSGPGELIDSYGLRTRLREMGLLNNKHIPAAYLRASRAQRLDLLRGLMDTDGSFTVARKQAVFVGTDKQLCQDVFELVASLGWRPNIYETVRSGFGVTTTCWDVKFTPFDDVPFLLPRKANLVVVPESARSRRRLITAITPVPSVPTQCIQVDSANSLYLAGHQMVPTHNTGKPSPPYKRARYGDEKADQMVAYGLAVESLDSRRPDELVLLFTAEQHAESYSPVMTPKTVGGVRRRFTTSWAGMKAAAASGSYELKPSPLCGWCPLATVCPAADSAGKSEAKIPDARTGERIGIPLAGLTIAVPELFGVPDVPAVPVRTDPVLPASSEPTSTEGVTMSNLFAAAEVQPWIETDPATGLLNPAAYAATAAFSLVSMATEALFDAGVPVTKDAVPALATVFADVIASAQSEVFGRTSMQENSHTRLRGVLHTAIKTIPIPFGQPDEQWVAWKARVVKRLISTARAAGELYVAGPQDGAWGPLTTLTPAKPSVAA